MPLTLCNILQVSFDRVEALSRETDRTQGVTLQAKIMYRPVFVPFRLSKILVYAVRDPAYTAEVFALSLVQIDVLSVL